MSVSVTASPGAYEPRSSARATGAGITPVESAPPAPGGGAGVQATASMARNIVFMCIVRLGEEGRTILHDTLGAAASCRSRPR